MPEKINIVIIKVELREFVLKRPIIHDLIRISLFKLKLHFLSSTVKAVICDQLSEDTIPESQTLSDPKSNHPLHPSHGLNPSQL